MSTTKISLENLLKNIATEFGSESLSVVLSMFDKINIDTNSDYQLDYIGELVSQPRNDLNDAEYKDLLKAKAAANASQGTYSQLVNIIKLLTNSDNVEINDNVAGVTIYLDGVLSTYLTDNIHDFLQTVLAEGVELTGIVQVAASNSFAFRSLVDSDDSTLGFGDTVGTGDYGEFTYLI
jgi:hypothetical protein